MISRHDYKVGVLAAWHAD